MNSNKQYQKWTAKTVNTVLTVQSSIRIEGLTAKQNKILKSNPYQAWFYPWFSILDDCTGENVLCALYEMFQINCNACSFVSTSYCWEAIRLKMHSVNTLNSKQFFLRRLSFNRKYLKSPSGLHKDLCSLWLNDNIFHNLSDRF